MLTVKTKITARTHARVTSYTRAAIPTVCKTSRCKRRNRKKANYNVSPHLPELVFMRVLYPGRTGIKNVGPTTAALDQETYCYKNSHHGSVFSEFGWRERGLGKKKNPTKFKVEVGWCSVAGTINGNSPGVLYLSRNYFHASRKDKSICQVGSKLRRSYRAGYTTL